MKLSESLRLSSFFEEATHLSQSPKKSANIILSVILAQSDWERSAITPEHVAAVLDLIANGTVSATGGKQIIEEAMRTGENAKDLVDKLALEQVSDSSEIEQWIDEVLEENPQTVTDFKAGKEKVIGFLVGQAMKKSAGSANPGMVQEIMKEKLVLL